MGEKKKYREGTLKLDPGKRFVSLQYVFPSGDFSGVSVAELPSRGTSHPDRYCKLVFDMCYHENKMLVSVSGWSSPAHFPAKIPWTSLYLRSCHRSFPWRRDAQIKSCGRVLCPLSLWQKPVSLGHAAAHPVLASGSSVQTCCTAPGLGDRFIFNSLILL